jgi:hypothetical protein
VQPEPARELLRRLPAEIDPLRDRRWRVERDEDSPHGWQQLLPASADAYAAYLAEILPAAPVAR